MTKGPSSAHFFLVAPVYLSLVAGCSTEPAPFEHAVQAAETGSDSSAGTFSSTTSGAVAAANRTGSVLGSGSASVSGAATIPRCGDGVVASSEECDEGALNSNTALSTCLTDCTLPYCGDGVLSSTEECDQGPANDDLLAGACRTNCEAARCGDGVIDEVGMGRCDEGEANSDTAPNACRTTCYLPTCGDGVRDVGEACDMGSDNGVTVGGAVVCTTDCRSSSCGNGQLDATEECDDGPGNSDVVPGACRTSCQRSACGDGFIDPGEACDDGSGNSGTQADHCRIDCSIPGCGDGVRDADEACDGGNGCDDECHAVVCGDNIIAGSEECDDGNGVNADTAACTTQCKTATCGDGLVQAGLEQCDEGAGNKDDTYGVCGTDCQYGERCGDGVVQAQEQCDLGANCNTSCQFAGCDGGQVRCGTDSMCVAPLTHNQFCGASGDCQGNNDGQICPADAQCSSGSCHCSNGGVICDSRCIDPKRDNYFCGALDNCAGDDKNGIPCANGTQCEDGVCVAQCDSSQKRCGDSCIAKDACCEADEDCLPPEMECTPGNPAGACCEDDDCEPGSVCDDGSCSEVEGPAVVSVSPADGTTGVLYDTKVVLTFDEAMDREAVESATSISGGFPVGTLTFSWNEASTVLTIEPVSGFTFRAVTSPTEDAYNYVLTVGTGAKNQAGNGLPSAFTSDFKSLRTVTQDFPATVAITDTTSGDLPTACSGNTLGPVGPLSSGQAYVFASINPAAMPEPKDIEIISARFRANQGAPIGDFYASQGDIVELSQVYTTVEANLFYNDLHKASLVSNFGQFSFNDASVLEKDITTRFESDFNIDFRYMEFRLSHAGAPPAGSQAQFVCGSLKVTVVYNMH